MNVGNLKGKLDGYAMRVPTPDVSVVDFVCVVNKNTSTEEVNAVLKSAAEGPMKGILAYTEDPVVSTDMLHNPNSSIVDAGLTKVMDGNLVKVVAWYDNGGITSPRGRQPARALAGREGLVSRDFT